MFFFKLFLLTLLNAFIKSQYINDRLDSNYPKYVSNHKDYSNYPNYISKLLFLLNKQQVQNVIICIFFKANAFDVDKSKVACDKKPYYYYDPFTYGKRTFFFLKSLRFSFFK